MLIKNTRSLTSSSLKDARLWAIIFPEEEHGLSQGTELGKYPSHFLAAGAKSLNELGAAYTTCMDTQLCNIKTLYLELFSDTMQLSIVVASSVSSKLPVALHRYDLHVQIVPHPL